MSKNKDVHFRLEEEELVGLQERANKRGMKVSKYLRYLVAQDAGYMTVNMDAEKELKRYFADTTRLGNNLNQMMREINSGFYLISAKEDEIASVIDQTRPLLVNIKSLLASLVRQTRV